MSWTEKYKVDINKFFNVNGKLYKEMDLKNKIKDLTLDECCEILSSNGMLIKRPIYMDDDVILFGFKQKEWEDCVLKK